MNQGKDGEVEHSDIFESEEDPFPNVDFIDSGSFSYRGSDEKPRRSKRPLVLGTALTIIILAVGSYFFLTHNTKKTDELKIQGKVAMSQTELRDVVASKHLTVYWAGALADTKYALITNKSGSVFVRYLPNGSGLNDSTTSYRVIATYNQKGAFGITKSAGGTVGNVGFINVDGNAVFYVKARPTNVYLGIKDKDIQIEIYDPGIDQALGLALIHNQITQITK